MFACFCFLCSVGDGTTEMKASLWQAKEGAEQNEKLEHLFTLPAHSEKLQGYIGQFLFSFLWTVPNHCLSFLESRVFWEPVEKIGRVISIDEGNIRLWNIDSKFSMKAAESISISSGDKKGATKLRTMAWNPHSSTQIGTANDCALRGWDLRTLRLILHSSPPLLLLCLKHYFFCLNL